jgi:hypothetical protein
MMTTITLETQPFVVMHEGRIIAVQVPINQWNTLLARLETLETTVASLEDKLKRAVSGGGLSIEEIAEIQGVHPIQSMDELKGDFWPEDQSVDDFIATVRKWRNETSVE